MKAWIIGGSSGIGLHIVAEWLNAGHHVVVSARKATHNDQLLTLQHQYPHNLYLLDLDVQQSTFENETKQAWAAFSGLDLVLYNAGAYEVMSLEQWDLKHFETMMQVNYFGGVKLLYSIIPYFEKQGQGRIVLNASMASYIGLPYGGGYSAPKAALVNLAESLYPELRLKNIHLQIINHGFVKTRLTDKNSFEMPQLMSPESAAKNIVKGIDVSQGFEIRFPFGLGAFLRVLRMLPYKLSLSITTKMLS